jgi:hypothetical protein
MLKYFILLSLLTQIGLVLISLVIPAQSYNDTKDKVLNTEQTMANVQKCGSNTQCLGIVQQNQYGNNMLNGSIDMKKFDNNNTGFITSTKNILGNKTQDCRDDCENIAIQNNNKGDNINLGDINFN